MHIRTIVVLALGVAALGLWIQACIMTQPPALQRSATPQSRPVASVSVSDVKLTEPTTAEGPYRIEGTLRHSGDGGQVHVAFRLRNRQTGEVIERRGSVDLRPGVVLVAVMEIQAPRADYAPEIEAQFAPR